MAYLFGAATTEKIAAGQPTAATTVFSLAIRFKPTQATNTQRWLAGYSDPTGGAINAFLQLSTAGTNVLQGGFTTDSGGAGHLTSWTSGFAAGSTHTVVLVYDGSTVKLYADTDPTAKASTDQSGTPDAHASRAFEIGNLAATSLSADSTIEEVAWYPARALTGAQAATLGAGGPMPLGFPTPASYWGFINDATDLFGSADGTVTGASLVAGTGTNWYPGTPPTLEFCPDGGTVDLVTMFTDPAQWATVRAKVSAFTFFAENLLVNAVDHTRIANNTQEALTAAAAFMRLRRWGIALQSEHATVPTPDAGAAQTVLAEFFAPTLAAGAQWTRINSDSALLRGNAVPQSQATTVTHLGNWITAAKAVLPGVAVRDIEPFPAFSVAEHIAWLDALEAGGVHLDGYVLDADWDQGIDMADLAAIGAHCESLDIPWGPIIGPGFPPTTDQEYCEASLAVATSVHAAGLPCQFLLVESFWDRAGTTDRDVPINLPESGPYTHTKLLADVAALFNVPDNPAYNPGPWLTDPRGRSALGTRRGTRQIVEA